MTGIVLMTAGCAQGATAARVESCVESTKFGAYIGEATATVLWNSVGQDDTALRTACTEMSRSDPDRLTMMAEEWDATQRELRAVTAGIPTTTADRSCDPSYPAMCIRMDSPDLSCSNIGATEFPVQPPDRHGLDTDGDGFGCVPGSDTG